VARFSLPDADWEVVNATFFAGTPLPSVVLLSPSVSFMKFALLHEELADISNRELECLKWCAEGKSSWEIGKILNCSEATVNFHFVNIRRKFSSNSRQQAVIKAIRLGLIPE
jgi:LuxR family quorum-sensing transcriptional regulator LasR